MHLVKTEVTPSNINEMSHVITIIDILIKKDKPLPISKPTKLQKSEQSVFTIEDSMINKVNEYLLTSSLKHQYLVKRRPFSTAKSIDIYDYLKPTQKDFKQEIFILHLGTNDLPLKKSPKKIPG